MKNKLISPYQFKKIVFDYTVNNSGNGYNKTIGLFVTLVKGVYVFSASLPFSRYLEKKWNLKSFEMEKTSETCIHGSITF